MSKHKVEMERLSKGLRKLVEADPWLALAIIASLTPDQWKDFVTGKVFVDLDRDLTSNAAAALKTFPLDVGSLASSVAHDVLLTLRNGTFLDNYDPEKGTPRVYMRGCAFNYAWVVARSIWRQYTHEEGGYDYMID